MKPILPKGTRDYSPIEVSRRNYMKEKIKLSYEKYGFEPIETPSFEKLEILKGNYSEEGDRLIFKILNSGEKLKKADIQSLKSNKISQFSSSISEKALRYDLTIPFARYVSKNQNEINFPFKRYQIQPVWRADRPQYDGDILLLPQQSWAFAVTWQTGILYVNRMSEKVQWSSARLFTTCPCFRSRKS